MEQLHHLIVSEQFILLLLLLLFLFSVSELPLLLAVGMVPFLIQLIIIVRHLFKRLSKTILCLGAVIGAVIAFVGMSVYIAEALARNRKSRII
jgi:hypothetical protein